MFLLLRYIWWIQFDWQCFFEFWETKNDISLDLAIRYYVLDLFDEMKQVLTD